MPRFVSFAVLGLIHHRQVRAQFWSVSLVPQEHFRPESVLRAHQNAINVQLAVTGLLVVRQFAPLVLQGRFLRRLVWLPAGVMQYVLPVRIPLPVRAIVLNVIGGNIPQ